MSDKNIDGISFSIVPKGQLIVPANIIEQLEKFRQLKSHHTEAGGILLGYQFKDKDDVVIGEITYPQSPDIRKRSSFYRSDRHHKIAVKRWKQSKGSCLYLGLWHTHPEPKPTPSNIDYHDWNKAITHGEFEGDNLFFIIVGTTDIYCWQGTRATKFKQILGQKNKFTQLSKPHE